MTGKRVPPSISVGMEPANARRSSSTGWEEPERLFTIRSVSRRYRRT
jgi:hypothetical protein